MKVPQLLFILTAAMLAVVILLCVFPVPDHSAGKKHEKFARTLLQGTPATRMPARIVWFGGVLGLLQIAFFVACLALGLGKRTQPTQGATTDQISVPGKAFLVVGFLVYAAVFSLQVLSYRFLPLKPDAPLVLGFPISTAVLLFGVWPVPFVFTLFYIWIYPRQVMTAQDHQRFQELLQARDSNS